jgi:site-specific DNA recombinase
MAKVLRCAIYTRKSSEEGLEQGFNSLHAQREACEAYVLSQAGEGWVPIKTAYDDGGFSGGSIDRPGLKVLLADIDAGKIDVVVVYKVDRLTRSLTDFARIVDRFDARDVSFVSVTQAFNTTSSMGRLTLNVLLSFAQFEREVTGERIRDKIAASKAKGMWMGGMLALGYDVADRTLTINEPEAKVVRHIFERYLELGSVSVLARDLEQEGVRSKAWLSLAGRPMGGGVISRGSLFHILRSRLYRGEIVHKDKVFPGLHPPIISAGLFEAVASKLRRNSAQKRDQPTRAGASVLTGLIFDASGEPMSPSFGYGRHGGRYRYYISMGLQVGKAKPAGFGIGGRDPSRRAALPAYWPGRPRRRRPDGLRPKARTSIHRDSRRS